MCDFIFSVVQKISDSVQGCFNYCILLWIFLFYRMEINGLYWITDISQVRGWWDCLGQLGGTSAVGLCLLCTIRIQVKKIVYGFRNSSRAQKDLLMSELLTKYFVFGIRECGDRLRRKCSRSDVKALLSSNLILCRKVTRLLGRADAASGAIPLNGARLRNCNGNLRWIK